MGKPHGAPGSRPLVLVICLAQCVSPAPPSPTLTTPPHWATTPFSCVVALYRPWWLPDELPEVPAQGELGPFGSWMGFEIPAVPSSLPSPQHSSFLIFLTVLLHFSSLHYFQSPFPLFGGGPNLGFSPRPHPHPPFSSLGGSARLCSGFPGPIAALLLPSPSPAPTILEASPPYPHPGAALISLVTSCTPTKKAGPRSIGDTPNPCTLVLP